MITLDSKTNYEIEKKYANYVETMKEEKLIFDNQFNENTKKWIMITRLQKITPEMLAILRILPYMNLEYEKELVIHVDNFTIPLLFKRNSFSLTTEKGLDSQQYYFEIERYSTGFQIDLEIYGTPEGAAKLSHLLQMTMDSFLYTLTLNCLKHLVLSPDVFVLDEFKFKNIHTFQSSMTLYNSFINCANKTNFRDMVNRYSEQIRANARSINIQNKDVVFVVPKEALMAMGNSVEERYYMLRGEKSEKVLENGALIDFGDNISLLPFTRSGTDGTNNFDNQRFFKELMMTGSVAYYNFKEVLKGVQNYSDFKDQGFWIELYDAKFDRMERIPLDALLKNCGRFNQQGSLDPTSHTNLIGYYKKNNTNLVEDDLDPFVKIDKENKFVVCKVFGDLRSFSQEYALKFAEIFIENYLKSVLTLDDIKNIDELLSKINSNVNRGNTIGFWGYIGEKEKDFKSNIKDDDLEKNFEGFPASDFTDSHLDNVNGYPMFDLIILNGNPDNKNLKSIDASFDSLFSLLKNFFQTSEHKEGLKKDNRAYKWALVQLVFFNVKSENFKEKIKEKYSFAGNEEKFLTGIPQKHVDNGFLDLVEQKMTEIMKVIGNRYFELDLEGVRPLYKLIILFYLMTDFNLENCKRIINKAKSPLPLSFRILRPHQRLRAFSGVFAIDKGDLGYSLVGTKKLVEGSDPSNLSKTIHFTGQQGIAIINKQLKVKKSGVLITDYISGLGTDFVDKDNYDPSMGKYKGDIIVQLGYDFSNVFVHSSLTGSIQVDSQYYHKNTVEHSLNIDAYYNLYWEWDKYARYQLPAFSSNSNQIYFNNIVSLENYSANGKIQPSSHTALGKHEPGLVGLLNGKGSMRTGFTNYNKN